MKDGDNLFDTRSRLQQPHANPKLRDKFAMAALTGMLAANRTPGALEEFDHIADKAFKYADSMMKRRTK